MIYNALFGRGRRCAGALITGTVKVVGATRAGEVAAVLTGTREAEICTRSVFFVQLTTKKSAMLVVSPQGGRHKPSNPCHLPTTARNSESPLTAAHPLPRKEQGSYGSIMIACARGSCV